MGFTDAIYKSIKVGVLGHYHAISLIFPYFILLACLGGIVFIYKKRFDRTYFISLFIIMITSLLYGLWNWQQLNYIKTIIPILSQIQMNRFHFLLPTLWYFLAAYIVGYLWDQKILAVKIITLLLLLLQSATIISNHSEIKNNISYEAFFSQELFSQLKGDLVGDLSEIKVACLGISPTVAIYNGLRTVDGYANLYALSHHQQFRKVIQKELDKSEVLKEYYDTWGSRCYLFSSELGRKFGVTKEENLVVRNLELNTRILTEMGCRYIISSVEIKNYQNNNLYFKNLYVSDKSAWNIFLYKII